MLLLLLELLHVVSQIVSKMHIGTELCDAISTCRSHVVVMFVMQAAQIDKDSLCKTQYHPHAAQLCASYAVSDRMFCQAPEQQRLAL